MTEIQSEVQRSRRPPGAARRTGRFQGDESKARESGRDEVYFLYIETRLLPRITQPSFAWGRLNTKGWFQRAMGKACEFGKGEVYLLYIEHLPNERNAAHAPLEPPL